MARMRLVGWVIVACLVAAPAVWAANTWIEVKSPNFAVFTDAGEGRGREVAWQFEQIRSAIAAVWPWARQTLDRPVQVVAAKDESSMKALLPQYWETRGSTRPASLLTTATDRHYIVLRSDVKADDTAGVNPFSQSYWAYSRLALDDALDGELPLWFSDGLASVLSNLIVWETELRFGLPIPWYLRSLQQEARLRLPELLRTDSTSPYFRSPDTRSQFDAQSWGFVHFLMFGLGPTGGDKVNQLAALLTKGTNSETAVSQVYGPLGPLENAYLQHSRKTIYEFSRLKVDTRISRKDFTARVLPPGEAAAVLAGMYVATRRPNEARAAIAESRAAGARVAAGFEAEAMLLEREGKPDEARAALAKAEELGSEHYYTYYKLASLTWPDRNDAEALAQVEKRLRRAVAGNEAFEPAHTLLADVLVRLARHEEALGSAGKAVSLEPRSLYPRMALARVYWAQQRRDEAKVQARTALGLAQTDQQRAQVQGLLDFFEKATTGP